jgi:hypothetical protein
MTNPFLKAEIEAAIKDIQDNINQIKPCFRITKPRSLLLVAFYHHQKDVRRTLKNGPRCNIDRANSSRDGQRDTSKHSSHERAATPGPYPRSQQRAGSLFPVTNNQQAARTTHDTAVCQRCGSMNIGITEGAGSITTKTEEGRREYPGM